MGVFPKRPGEETGESTEEDLYTFSSRPTPPGERRIPDIHVRFQAVGQTHPCIEHHYFNVHSITPLNQIRRHIQSFFRPVFEKGFIFLRGDREILKNTEAKLTLFDILPKLYHGKPSKAFQYPSVSYKQVSVDYEGRRYSVTCACVVFLFERSQMSHWRRKDLQAELCADIIQGFSFIPSNIMSCTGELIDTRTTTMHMHAACAEKSELEAALHQMKREDYTAENLRDQRLANPLHYTAANGVHAALYNMKREDHAAENLRDKRLANTPHHTAGSGNQAGLWKTKREDDAAENLRKQRLANPGYNTEANRHSAMCVTLAMCETLVSSLGKEIIYQKDINGKTPLHCALYRKQMDVVVYLLQLDPDLLTQDDLGNSCFELLVRLKERELSKIMSAVRREDCVGDLACLHFACTAMRTKNIKEARRFSKKLEPANFLLELGRSPLHLAAILGDTETAENIIEKGYALMDRDSVGFLPFHYACRFGHRNLLKLLYSAKFDDEDINEAVVHALRGKNYQCAKKACLLASTMIFEEDTIFYIMKALERNFDRSWKYCLPMLGFDKSVLGMYLLQYAREGRETVVARICKLGVDVNFQDLMSRTPLHEASQMGHTKVAKILMDSDADPNIVDWRRSTPLHYACMAGQIDVVKLLLSYSKVKADIQDVCGRTPFMTAAYYKRQKVLEHLVSSDLGNLNIHAVDKYGCNILHYAINMTAGEADLLIERYSSFATQASEEKIQIANPQFDSEKVMLYYKISSSGKYMFDGEKSSDGTLSVPFAYKRDVCSWNDRKKHLQIKQPRKLTRSVFLCSKCGKGYRPRERKAVYLKARHCCLRDEQMDTSTDMQPFQCHHTSTWSDGSTALHHAARIKSDHLLKKLVRMFPQMAFERDDIGRTLLELSVDLLSPKILTIALECTKGERRARDLVSRAINVRLWGKEETSRMKCVDLLLSNNTIFPFDEEVFEEGHKGTYLRDLSPLALATKLNKIQIVKCILDNKASNTSQALCVALENGNLNLVEILLKHFHESKQSKDTVYKAFNLDDACASSNVSLPLIKLLCEEFPDMLKLDSFSGTFGPLYHLLQKKHPYKKKTRSVDAKKDLEKIAVYLVKNGLYHGLVNVDEKDTASRVPINGAETEYRYPHQYHLTCQSVKAAVDNSSWEVLDVLMQEQGDLFWKCCFTSVECSVQCERYSLRGEVSDIQEKKRQYLFEIFLRLLKTDVPFQLVGQFLQKGARSLQAIGTKELLSATWDYNSYLPSRLISQFYHANLIVRENLNDLEKILSSSEHLNYLEKLLLPLSVFLHSDALIRLLILAPSLFPLLKLSNRNMSVSTKAFSCMRNSFCLQHSQSSPFLSHSNMTLLHMVCCSSDVELLKQILQSPLPLNINERTKLEDVHQSDTKDATEKSYEKDKSETTNDAASTEKIPGLPLDTETEAEPPPSEESTGFVKSKMVGLTALDVASACGNYETVKLLLKYGAIPDSHTLQACIVGHKYQGIKSWSDIICGFPKANPNEEKERRQVAERLIKEAWEGKESGPSELHLIMAVKHKRWDILECLLQRGISMDSVFSDSDLSRIVFQFSTEPICSKLVSCVSEVKLIINPECLGEAFHGASLRENSNVLRKLLETFNETIENYNVLQVKTFLQISKNEGRSRQETVLHILAKKGWFSMMKSLVCQLQKQKGEDGSEISKKKGKYDELSIGKGTGSKGKSRNGGKEKEDDDDSDDDDDDDDDTTDEDEEQDNKVGNDLRNARYLAQESFVNIKDEHQRTPLWYAIVNGHWNIAHFLILYNANTGSLPVPGLDVKRTFVETLSIEKVTGRKRKFKNHVNQNSNPPIFDLKSYCSPSQPQTVLSGLYNNDIVHMTLKLRTQKVSEEEMKVRKLIPIMNEAKNVGCTILHIAAGHRNVPLVQELLKANPLMSKTLDRSGLPAYVYAVSAKDSELFRMLFDEQLMNIRLGKLCLDIAIRSLLDQRHLRTIAEKSLLRTMQLIYEPYKEFGETPIPIPELEKQLKNFKGAKAKVKYILSGLGDGGDFVKDIVTFLDNVERIVTGLDWYPALNTRRNMDEGSLKEFIEFFMDKLMITTIESASIYCLAVIGDLWILHKLLEHATKSDKNRKKLVPFIGELSFMDIVVIIGIAKNQQWLGDTGRLTMTLDKLPAVFNLQVLQLAADKGCWFDLTRIAKDVFKYESELTDAWTYVCCAAAREGHEELFNSIFENMDRSKIDEEEEIKWTYILFIACLSGHTGVVKKLHQNGVQLIPKIKNALLGKSLIGEKFSQEHSILHYASKGNNDSCLRLVLRILLDKNQSVEIGDILKCIKFVGENGNVKMLDILLESLESSGIGIPKDSELSSVLLDGAKRCHETFCLRLVESANIDPRFSDGNGINVLHYAGLFGLSKLAKAITDKEPRTVDIPDNFNMSPLDYARQMGRRETIAIFKASSSKKSADLNEHVLEANGWFSLLMEENTKMKMEQSLSSRSPRFYGRHLSLENLLRTGDDQAASVYLSICQDELSTYLIKFPNGAEILHLIARHGCIKSLKVILNALEETMDVDTVLNMEYKLITPLATAIKYEHIECVKALLSHSSEQARQWKSNITGENILHFAIKSENVEIVSILMAEGFTQDLRHSPDLRGLTPVACAAALGLHDILHAMCGEGEATDKNHVSHKNDASFYCTECILDRCVGWSKVYQAGHIFEKNIRGENISLLTELDRSLTSVSSNRASRFYYDPGQIQWLFSFSAASDTLARSVVTSLGCNASTTPYKRQDQEKAVTDFLVNKMLDEDESIPMSIIHFLASTGKVGFLKSVQDFWKAPGRHEGNHRYEESLSESAYAFGFLNVGRYIDSEIRKTGDTPKYRHFEQLRNILPPKIMWCTGLSHPGDDIWLQSIMEEDSRMSFADVWIISPMENSLREEMEKNANLTDMVPKDFQGKKLSMDVESFRKQKQLMSKNEVWLRAFLASSLIYGRMSSLMRCSDSKLTDSTSLKVKCLTESYGEQAKTTIEVDGSLTEAVVLKTVEEAIVIQYDEGPQNRTIESQIRARVQSEILPNLENQLKAMINGRQVCLRVDWRSIESRRISSSFRQILGALCGDEFDNALGGLQDVIRHCEDMLENIRKMFSPETANLALSLMSQNTEIIVRYIDSTPSSQTQPKSSFFMPNPTWVWTFTIDAGVLKYDRSTLPLWNLIKLYHSVCINLITGLTNIAFEKKPVNDILSRRGVTITRRNSTISSDKVSVQSGDGTMRVSSRNSDQITSRGKKQTDINRRNITLDVDVRSFSKIQSSEVIVQLFRDKIYYEMCLLDVTYKGLLWFDTCIRRLVLSGTSAKHGSSIVISNGTLSLDFNVRPAQNGKWVVDSLDSLQKLNQIEERELRQSWTEATIPDAERDAQTVVQEIKEKTGLSVALNIDEQMIMSSVIEKNRNEMEHPFTIAGILTKIATTRLRSYFTESIKNFVEWDICLMDWMTVDLPPGNVSSKLRDRALATLSRHSYRNDYLFSWLSSHTHRIAALIADSSTIHARTSTIRFEGTLPPGLWYVPTMKTLRKDNFLGKVLLHRTIPYKPNDQNRTCHIRNDFEELKLLNSKEELPKSFENVHGIWVLKPFHKLEIQPDTYKNDRLQLLSQDGRLYRILDRKTLLEFLQSFPLKKLVGQDAMKSAEKLSCNFFDPNVSTTETRVVDPKLYTLIHGLDKELCTWLDKLVLSLPEFGANVSISWSSFVSKEKGLTETKLRTSIEALISTFHQLFDKRRLLTRDTFRCEHVKNAREVIARALDKIVTLYVSCKSEDQVVQHKGLRVIHGDKYGEKCDVLILSETEINIIVTGRKQNVTFLKTFEEAVVQMMELELEKEFTLTKEEAEVTNTSTEPKLALSVSKLDSKQAGKNKNKAIVKNERDEYSNESKTPLDLHLAAVVTPYVSDGLRYIRDTVRRKLPEFFHVSLLQSSDDQTTIKCENCTLEIRVSPMDLTAETILKELIYLSESLEKMSTLSATGANDVIFKVDSDFYFPRIGTNTFTLEVCMKTGNAVPESFLQGLSKDSFRIETNAADTTLAVNSVQKIDTNKLQIVWIAPENMIDEHDVLITLLGKQIGNIKPLIFKPDYVFYTNVSPNEDEMALSTCRESYFCFYLIHDMQCIVQDSANLHLKGKGTPDDSKNLCYKTVHLRGWSISSSFALIFSYQKRKYPGIGERVPFKVTRVRHVEENCRIVVRYTCLDSHRKVHIRALCKTCKCYLRIYTPFFSVPPNKSLTCQPE